MMVNTPPSRTEDAPENHPDPHTSPEDTQGIQSPESQPSTVPSQPSQPSTQTASGDPSTPNRSVPGSGSEFLTPALRTPVNSAEGAGSPPDARPPATRIRNRLGRELSYSDDGVVQQARFGDQGELPGM
jgi:hypothetical protein